MPKIDLSFGVTAIIAICALLSPILTALLNNRHQIKIKRRMRGVPPTRAIFCTAETYLKIMFLRRELV